ncbi:hypothetical protein CEN49_06500 [Fischerella thermalis CCMEE 5273]|uniref:YtkA-like domain-containing protein n=1 Tax=Chlorogloeopsis fritschii PCC 6912 TaxID=211165 RepID=A0A3S0XY60_CHLFR|nr:hypothetical protein [Chlorogloeopsis fritschii]PMB09472.1 hypothetical protein CEN49_06500 [Fischerella thermalis CCMEE 5273]PMB50416.1 hypothetical protein CEN40_02010 [Fischerella thermalis CCMEE 5205]RUR83730.1 hypothetical protein PCC6912_19730 [Chlorogloeopsis fritschii PCC 6912]
MKLLKTNFVVLGSVGLLFLGACSGSNQVANSESGTASTTETAAKSEITAKDNHSESDGHFHNQNNAQGHSEDGKGEHSHGGQVIESGQYHLEFVAEPKDDGNHLDFYLKKGEKHDVVPDAKVTAQVQLPDGSQKSLPLTYEAKEQHYHAVLSEKAAGEYKVAILSDINGEKVNGRFTFKR